MGKAHRPHPLVPPRTAEVSMILKPYIEFTHADHEWLRDLRNRLKGTHLRDVTLMYNYNIVDDSIVYAGVLSPFVSEPSNIELALLCGYLTEYRCGGEVTKDQTGGFRVVMKLHEEANNGLL